MTRALRIYYFFRDMFAVNLRRKDLKAITAVTKEETLEKSKKSKKVLSGYNNE